MQSVITAEEINRFYDDGILKREGQFHAQIDDTKDVIMCKLAHISPRVLGAGKRVTLRDKIVSKAMDAWMEDNQDISKRLTGNTIEQMRVALRDIFIELLDERTFDVLPHSNPRHRKSRDINTAQRKDIRQKIERQYFGSLTLEDFDMERNRKNESSSNCSQLIKEAQSILSQAMDEEKVVPNSPIQIVFFQQAIDLIEKAKKISK